MLSDLVGRVSGMRADLVPDDLWQRVAPLLPPAPEWRRCYPGRLRVPDRAALAGVMYVLRTGVAWRDVPWTGRTSGPSKGGSRRSRSAGTSPPQAPASTRGPGLRLRQVPPPTAETRRRPRVRTGQGTLGGRACLRLAAPVQTAPYPIRTTRRSPPGPPRAGLQPHMPPPPANLILKRPVSGPPRSPLPFGHSRAPTAPMPIPPSETAAVKYLALTRRLLHEPTGEPTRPRPPGLGTRPRML